MQFHEWLNLNESNINQLYDSTVRAYPRTTKRQHSVDEINVLGVSWVPYKGMKTLFIKGSVVNDYKRTEYNPMILFKNVKYHDDDMPFMNHLVTNEGQSYFFEKFNNTNHVLVRCNCKDFQYRFKYENHLNKSLYGHKGKKYIGQGLWEANPLHLEGMCKHIIKLSKTLENFFE